uniref:MYND-type domain-containing protein n=1 Tax=Meloidogyne incognita TaxID=6306 RepID=A0A914NMJ3_MELIC
METSSTSTKLDFYPFAYALFDECLEKHCWYCLDDEKKLKRCTGCQNAMFCDKNCQSLGWKDHKFECKGIKLNKGQVPDIEVRLLGRIVSRHKAILCGLDKKDPDFYKNRQSKRKIMEIWAHTERIKNDEYAMRKFEGIYERLCRFYDPKAMLNKQIMFELHCRDFINRHAISDKHYLREIGKGLYLDLCAYDHSCRPNTVYSCHSFIATLRSLDSKVNILDYSSTFYSYIDLLCAKQDRRKLLKDTWYFTCECSRCQDESEQILSSMLCPNCEYSLCIFGKSEYKNSETQLITCPSCNKMLEKGQVLEAISAMCFISDVIEQTNFQEMGEINAQKFLQDLLSRHQKILPPINVYMCKIVQ